MWDGRRSAWIFVVVDVLRFGFCVVCVACCFGECMWLVRVRVMFREMVRVFVEDCAMVEGKCQCRLVVRT